MENILGFVTMPSILVICYLIGEAVKATRLDNKYIPVICGTCGGILGIAALFTVPDFAADIFTAAATGIVSGLSATGINQIYKQFKG